MHGLRSELLNSDNSFPADREELASIRDRILTLLAGDIHGEREPRSTVVLGVDGLADHVARAAWSPDSWLTLASGFPSTSATAWLSAITGMLVHEHGVCGAAYRLPELDAVVDAIRLRALGTDAPYEQSRLHEAVEDGFGVLRPTLFEQARTLGFGATAVVGDLRNAPGPWVDALLRGARRVASPGPPALDGLSAHVAGVVMAVERALAEAGPTLVWAYVNLDEHVHLHGYDAAVAASLETLELAARRWTRTARRVVAHSDHGLVPTNANADAVASWERIDSPRNCRLPSGGAGRVRWLYPLAGFEERVFDQLSVALAGYADVMPIDALESRGLMRLTPGLRDRVGGVVAIATSAEFPVPDPSLAFEHGATEPDEVDVPFTVWEDA